MKKWCVGLAAALLLTGCSGARDLETVTDVYGQEAVARQVSVSLPEEAAVPVGSQSDGVMYICQGYTVAIQTLPGGDLDRTLRSVTGFPKEKLALLNQSQGQLQRYDCAFSCAGEGGDRVGRCVLLDDGHYHYVLTVLMDAGMAGDLAESVNALCASFKAA